MTGPVVRNLNANSVIRGGMPRKKSHPENFRPGFPVEYGKGTEGEKSPQPNHFFK